MSAPQICRRLALALALIGFAGGSVPVVLAADEAKPVKPALASKDKPSVGSSKGGLLGARVDSDEPIEITSDTLEVKQNEQLAVFRGKVDAIQGTMRLRADRLTVHYRENKEDPKQPGISKIEADGNVFVSSPGETASGARGVYYVDRSRIDLFDNVVLTQGNNVLKGQRLEMNLATGESKVAGEGGRVRGVFVPEKKTEQSDSTKPSQKKN